MPRSDADTDLNDELDDEELDPTDPGDDADLNAIADDEFEGLTDDDVDDEGEGTGDLLDNDEDDETVIAVAGDAPAGVEDLETAIDRGDGRTVAGKFAPKAAEPAAAAPAAEAAATPAAPAAPAAPTAQQWEPLVVRADKTDMPIEEATLTRANGHHLVAIKDADYPRFQQRMSKAVVAERVWRQLHDGVKELESERAAPQAKTDEQIEAEVVMEAMKPFLDQVFDERDMELLEARVKLAQNTHRKEHAETRTTYFAEQRAAAEAAEQPDLDDHAQLQGIASEMLSIVEAMPELKDLTETQLRAAYGELTRVKRAAFWKEGTEWFANRELMYDTLKRSMSTVAAAPPVPGHTAPAPTSAPTAPTGTTKGERFNRAQDSAARPAASTTSLKANRGTSLPRSARPTGDTTKKPKNTAAMVAEDTWRKTASKFMSSDSLDFESDDDA